MKISVVLCLLLALTACDSDKPSSPVASSPSPSSTANVGPMSDDGPKPSPMPSGNSPSSATIAPNSMASKLASPTPDPFASIFPGSSTGSVAGAKGVQSSPNSVLPTATTAPKGAEKDPKAVGTSATAGKPNTITTESIGTARIGMTFGELKKTLGQSTTFEVTNDFAVNFNAIAVKKQGKVQFYIPYERSSKLADEAPIHYLVTDNPSYKTEQGVSPGMTIKQAAQIYGAARLRLNRDQESKETVYFAQQPAQITFYGVLPGGKDFAGVYPDSNEPSALETDRYNDKAQIGKIIVACRPEVCGGEH